MALPLRAKLVQGLRSQRIPQEGAEHTVVCKRQNKYQAFCKDVSAGVALMCLISMVLLWQVASAHVSLLVVPFLGAYCIIRGSKLRNATLLMLGSLVSGVGLGYVLTIEPFHLVSGDLAGSLFLFAFALGWFSIVLLSRLYTRHTQWWPLIPGSMLAATSLYLIV